MQLPIKKEVHTLMNSFSFMLFYG